MKAVDKANGGNLQAGNPRLGEDQGQQLEQQQLLVVQLPMARVHPHLVADHHRSLVILRANVMNPTRPSDSLLQDPWTMRLFLLILNLHRGESLTRARRQDLIHRLRISIMETHCHHEMARLTMLTLINILAVARMIAMRATDLVLHKNHRLLPTDTGQVPIKATMAHRLLDMNSYTIILCRCPWILNLKSIPCLSHSSILS